MSTGPDSTQERLLQFEGFRQDFGVPEDVVYNLLTLVAAEVETPGIAETALYMARVNPEDMTIRDTYQGENAPPPSVQIAAKLICKTEFFDHKATVINLSPTLRQRVALDPAYTRMAHRIAEHRWGDPILERKMSALVLARVVSSIADRKRPASGPTGTREQAVTRSFRRDPYRH